MMNRNILKLISVLFIFSACVPVGDKTALNSTTTSGKDTTSTTGSSQSLEAEATPTVKLFNQYNQTLSKITGINSATTAISTEYETIKNSLPADHSAYSFTSFHQIAMTRLSFAYCNYFISNDSEFKAVNYMTATSDALTTKLIVRFLGAKDSSNATKYDQFYAVILKILKNDAGTDTSTNTAIGKLIPNATGATLNLNLTKLGCTAILASSEYTTM
jgi:hypothetical protein